MRVLVVVESQDCTTGAMRSRLVKVWLSQRNGRGEWRMMLFLTFRRRGRFDNIYRLPERATGHESVDFCKNKSNKFLGYIDDDVDVAIPTWWGKVAVNLQNDRLIYRAVCRDR